MTPTQRTERDARVIAILAGGPHTPTQIAVALQINTGAALNACYRLARGGQAVRLSRTGRWALAGAEAVDDVAPAVPQITRAMRLRRRPTPKASASWWVGAPRAGFAALVEDNLERMHHGAVYVAGVATD